MKLQILTPEKSLFEGDIHLVSVPGEKGAFEILDKHAPIVSTLEKGTIKVITKKGEEKFFDINSGFVEVKNNQVYILVN